MWRLAEDIEPCTLQSGLLELERVVSPKERVYRRCMKSVSLQGLVIIVQAISLAVVLGLLFLQTREVNTLTEALVSQGDHAGIGPTSLNALGSLPYVRQQHKYAVQHVTPAQFQWVRGTCWDFTIISVLEHSYRVNGIENGWLKPDEYIKFSQQALGATLMEYCRKGHAKFCMSPSDDLWTGNSTEGAESQLLYYVNELQTRILPHSVCPYTKNPGHDGVCPGMHAAQKQNPISFYVKHMTTSYDRVQIKSHLSQHGRAMALAATLVGSHFYLPCLPEFTSKPGMYQKACANQCVQCPSDHAYHSLACCAMIERPGYNMEGEFWGYHPAIDGGHAMTLVGWNDLFRTTSGDLGGWILKNSWFDGVGPQPTFKHARGSHSIGWFMSDISDTDERKMCPNSYNPRNWYACAGQNGVMAGVEAPPPSHYTFDHMVSVCTQEATKLRAAEERRVLSLRCQDSNYCNTAEGSKLFMINATSIAGGLHRMCFLEKLEAKISEFCLPPLLVDDVAMFIHPAAHEMRENDRDACGFYFFPYNLIEETNSMIGAQTYDVQGFDIQWNPSSYDRGPLNSKDLDYSQVKKSTHVQKSHVFTGDLPNMQHPQ